MHSRLYGLTSHPDVTRFEVEDGIVRNAVATLLGDETTINTVVVDVGASVREATLEDPNLNPDALHDVMIAIHAEVEADSEPPNLAELVADVAVVGGSWSISSTELAELEKPWVGTASPGPKVTAFARPTDADSPRYRAGIAELARETATTLGDVGSRVVHVEGTPGSFSTAISFWFPNPDAAKAAWDRDGFAPLIASDLIDQHSLALLEATEHVLAPNPNTWVTTSGVEPSPAE